MSRRRDRRAGARLALMIAFLLTLFSRLTAAHDVMVIYGDDDRLDYYQVRGKAARRDALATVALIYKWNLNEQNDGTIQIVSQPYGKSQGLCDDEPFYDQETAAFCSGFLIAPDTVVTAGHCVSTPSACNQTRFIFNFLLQGPGEQPRAVDKALVFSCKRLEFSVSLTSGEDFAIVQLDRPVIHVEPLKVRESGQPSVGDHLEVMGYPAGLPLKVAGGAQVRVVRDQFLVANVDTYGGNSGSAVVNTKTGLVEGVLVRGEMDWEYRGQCRVSKHCSDTDCRGEDVTLIERVLARLNNRGSS